MPHVKHVVVDQETKRERRIGADTAFGIELLVRDAFDKAGQKEVVVVIAGDNGAGCIAEYIQRMFAPFHTTKPQGTGLGLAVTHKILQAHDARVFVESIEGQGTKFLVEFPAHRDVHTEDLIPLKQVTKG